MWDNTFLSKIASGLANISKFTELKITQMRFSLFGNSVFLVCLFQKSGNVGLLLKFDLVATLDSFISVNLR